MATVRITKQVNSGDSYTVRATPATGFTFNGWSSSGSRVSTDNPYTATPNSDVLLNAVFQTNQQYTITTSVNSSSYGTASGGGTFNSGATCTLTATPNTGYSFVCWSESGGDNGNGGNTWSSNPYSFTVNKDRHVEANFTANSGSITNFTAGGWAYDTYSMGTAYLYINNTQIAVIDHSGGKVSVSKTGTYPKTFYAGDVLKLDCTRMAWVLGNTMKLKIRYSSNNYLIEAGSATVYTCSLTSWTNRNFPLSAGLY